jgi:glycosyltransferase involved in cell wall biosynthesis
MRIGLVSRWLENENRRGGGTVRQLAEAVQALGHEIVALTQHEGPEARVEIGKLQGWATSREQRRPGTYAMDKLGKAITGHRKLVTDALALHAFLQREGPFDVLWAQCEEPDGLVAALASKLGPMPPFFVHIFALRYRFGRHGEPRFTHRRVLGWTFRKAALVAANSPMVAEAAIRHYGVPSGRIEVLPHNLTSQFLDNEAGEPAIDPDPDPRVLFLGAMNEKKGALVFAEAATHLARQWPTAKFVMAGGRTERNVSFDDRLRVALARSGLGPRLEQPGQLSPTEVNREIRRAWCVALPSLWEEWSRALVETLVAGRRAITTATTGAAYLVKDYDAGAIVPPNDPPSLARAIDGIFRSGPRPLPDATRERLRFSFSPEAIARQTAGFLTRACRGSPGQNA